MRSFLKVATSEASTNSSTYNNNYNNNERQNHFSIPAPPPANLISNASSKSSLDDLLQLTMPSKNNATKPIPNINDNGTLRPPIGASMHRSLPIPTSAVAPSPFTIPNSNPFVIPTSTPATTIKYKIPKRKVPDTDDDFKGNTSKKSGELLVKTRKEMAPRSKFVVNDHDEDDYEDRNDSHEADLPDFVEPDSDGSNLDNDYDNNDD